MNDYNNDTQDFKKKFTFWIKQFYLKRGLKRKGSLKLGGTTKATHDIQVQTILKKTFNKLNLQGEFVT